MDEGDDEDQDGYTIDEDCNDKNGWANPGMIEMCDGIDNNCDGQIDEGCEEEEQLLDPGGSCSCTAVGAAGTSLWFLPLLGLVALRRKQAA